MNKVLYKVFGAIIFIFVVVAGVLIIKPSKYVKYEEKLLGINIGEFVSNGSGKLEKNYGEVKFEIKTSKLELLEETLSKAMTLEEDFIAKRKGSEIEAKFSKDLKKLKVINYYSALINNKEYKNKEVFAVICKDKKKDIYYLYIYG